jgi:hypothetical protein
MWQPIIQNGTITLTTIYQSIDRIFVIFPDRSQRAMSIADITSENLRILSFIESFGADILRGP